MTPRTARRATSREGEAPAHVRDFVDDLLGRRPGETAALSEAFASLTTNTVKRKARTVLDNGVDGENCPLEAACPPIVRFACAFEDDKFSLSEALGVEESALSSRAIADAVARDADAVGPCGTMLKLAWDMRALGATKDQVRAELVTIMFTEFEPVALAKALSVGSSLAKKLARRLEDARADVGHVWSAAVKLLIEGESERVVWNEIAGTVRRDFPGLEKRMLKRMTTLLQFEREPILEVAEGMRKRLLEFAEAEAIASAWTTWTTRDGTNSESAGACEDREGVAHDVGSAYKSKRVAGAYFKIGDREWFNTSKMGRCSHALEKCETCDTRYAREGCAEGCAGDILEFNQFVRQYLRSVHDACAERGDDAYIPASETYSKHAVRSAAVKSVKLIPCAQGLVFATMHMFIKRLLLQRGSSDEAEKTVRAYIDILFDRADSEVIAFDEVHRLASTYLQVYDAVYTPDLAIKFPSKMTKALGALGKALLH
jgi:hypothetical protein